MTEGKKTAYKVLRRSDKGNEMWYLAGEANATSAKAAIQAAFIGDGMYVAVPERSWKPDMVVSKSKAFLAFGTEAGGDEPVGTGTPGGPGTPEPTT